MLRAIQSLPRIRPSDVTRRKTKSPTRPPLKLTTFVLPESHTNESIPVKSISPNETEKHVGQLVFDKSLVNLFIF